MVVSQLCPESLDALNEVRMASGGAWCYKNVASVLTISVQADVLATECQAVKTMFYPSQSIVDCL